MAQLLPPELMELQIAQIDLILAMYPEEDCIMLDDETRKLIEDLRIWCEASPSARSVSFEAGTVICLTLKNSEAQAYEMVIKFPIVFEGTECPSEPPPPTVRLKQPSWMSKADALAINSRLTLANDLDVFASIEFIRDAVVQHIEQSANETTQASTVQRDDERLVRVWFYFPSISTRSKRDDIINHAPSYNLTGFLLAGKPGILCLEGASRAIDDYMKFIKTESWGDIPAHHKKVNERYREADVERRFEGMREVTDEVGERRGERANRTDMKALEAWLAARGFGYVMKKIVI